MPRRVVFTNPLTGRFISAEDAAGMQGILRRVYEDGNIVEESVLDFGSIVEDIAQTSEENWYTKRGTWGDSWVTDDDMLSLSALQATAFPEGYRGFRVRYTVATNPDYPQGFASSDWFRPEQWPPDLSMASGLGATGIAMIHFEQ